MTVKWCQVHTMSESQSEYLYQSHRGEMYIVNAQVNQKSYKKDYSYMYFFFFGNSREGLKCINLTVKGKN